MTSRSRLGGALPPAPSLSTLAVATTALTFVLMLLGIWTAVGGYGLTCNGRWPFCDGAVFGLFPANYGSFVEWFHRLVAMITGFAILGTAIAAWRDDAALRVRAAFALALVLTPFQIVLGALTVTRYEVLILVAHFSSALAILAFLAAGTLWTVDRVPSVDRFGAIAAIVLVPAIVLTPGVLVTHSVELHIVYYALGLAGCLALLAASLARTAPDDATRFTAAVGAAAAAVALIVGRVRLDPTGQAAILVGFAIAIATAIATIWLSRRSSGATGSVVSTHS